ncbi:MAG: rhodanese-like domain-containing protein, partial [Oscillospiraceae bacterium]|nr:rhodanese-like domain-containing protein [Oscillospiraceae bacterium]
MGLFRKLSLGIIIFLTGAVVAAGCGTRVSDAHPEDQSDAIMSEISTAEQSEAPSGAGRISSMEGYVSRYNPAHIDSIEAWAMISSDSDAIMLDVRSEATYLESHVSIAVNVPFEELADYTKANIADKDRVIVCYCFCDDKGGSALSACELLADLGYTKVFYTEPGDEWTYEGAAVADADEENSASNIVTGAEAKELYESNDTAVLLDVRSLEEYDEGHIVGSMLIPVAELENRLF